MPPVPRYQQDQSHPVSDNYQAKEWQIASQITKLAIGLSVLGYSLPAVAGNCTTGGGTADLSTIPYISAEVSNSSTVSQNITNAQNNADILDDKWRTAILPQTSTSWASTNTGSISNNVLNLFTINGISVDVALVNVDSSGNCAGAVNSGTSSPELNNALTLQGGAPRPSSLPSTLASYWNENTGSTSNRNGVLFTFSQPVSAFGAWFGDLETRSGANGTPAILRLLDATGNRIGSDILITPSDISNNGGSFVALDQSTCSNIANGCGNNSTRWVGFVDSTARVKQALVIVGDQTTSASTGGNGEHLSFIGANLVSANIAGTVFEDVNYGGGAGRPLNTTATARRPGARVELYDGSGVFKAFTTTDSNGIYKFGYTNVTGGIVPGNYTVRVVNNTVTSSRTGSASTLLPVQTFRTNGLTTDNIGTADPNRVGGETPKLVDAGNGSATVSSLTTTTTTAQSITPITVGTAGAAGIDFGFNFDTIVNTNDAGQGSLRQFITNSNALKGEGSLIQVGQPAGYETSIFMIPNSVSNPGQNTGYTNQLTGGIAVINLSSGLSITDPKTRLDGSTQTTNIKATPGGAETNPGQIGTGGTVGTSTSLANSLAKFDRPEIEIKGKYTLTATGSYNEIKNIAFNASNISVSGSNSLVQDNLVGMSANGSVDAITAGVPSYGITAGAASNINIKHNYVRVNNSGIRRDNNGSNLIVEYNEVDVPSSGHAAPYDGILLINTGSNDTIRYNLVKNMGGAGAEIGFGSGTFTNTLIDNNTFKHNGYIGTNPSRETMGVVVYSAFNSQISLSNNVITESSGSGVVVLGSTGLSLTKNSIFQNGAIGNGAGLSIDLDPINRGPNTYDTANGVTPNTGTVSASLPNGGMNYPIFTKVQRVGNTLKLEGYIGNTPAGNSAFTGATIEIYKADNDSNQNGQVIAGDNLNKPHGEGRYWIGNLTAGTNGLFNFSLPIPASLTDGLTTTTLGATDEITAIATSSATASIAPRSTSEFSANTPITLGNPNLLLVKRITKINNSQLIGSQYDLSKYINDPNDFYDDNVLTSPMPVQVPTLRPDTNKWPNTPNSTSSTFLIGGINGGSVKPQDEIEYTIYFLSTGDSTATNVLFCDRVPSNVTFVPTAFNTYTLKATGGINDSRGIVALLNGNTESYTNVADGDAARYFPAGSNPQDVYPKVNCNGTNDNGAVVVNLGSLPPATTPGNPIDSYGFVRFRGQVK